MGPRMGADSWGGELVGDGITLSFGGGPFSVSGLYEIVEGGPSAVNPELAAHHVVETVPIVARSTTLVRPRDGNEGRMGVLLDLPMCKLGIIAHNLTRDEQAVALAIFSIQP